MSRLEPIPAQITVSRLDSESDLQALRPDWSRLSQAVARPSCFASPAYFDAWRSTLAETTAWEVLVARRGGALVGVMPLMTGQVRRGPMAAPRHDFSPDDRAMVSGGGRRLHRLRQISPVVSIPASLVGPAPLAQECDRADVARAIVEMRCGAPGWDTFAVPVSGQQDCDDWCRALAAYRPWVMELGRHIHAIAEVRPFAQMVAGTSRNFRKNIRKAQTAAQQGGLVFRRSIGARDVAERMPVVAQVAQQSWKGREARGAGVVLPYEGAQQRFYEALLAQPTLETDITPVLVEASIGDRPIAVLLSLRHGDRLTAVVTFRTPELPEASPGLLLIGDMIDWAAHSGIRGYDLNLTRNWVRGLTDHVTTQRVVVCYGPTLRGRVARASSALMRCVR